MRKGGLWERFLEPGGVQIQTQWKHWRRTACALVVYFLSERPRGVRVASHFCLRLRIGVDGVNSHHSVDRRIPKKKKDLVRGDS